VTPGELLASLPAAERIAFADSLTPAETIALLGLLNDESPAATHARLERVARLRRMARELETIASAMAIAGT
jgi:hypothetical protein